MLATGASGFRNPGDDQPRCGIGQEITWAAQNGLSDRAFVRNYAKLPPEVQAKFDKQLGFLLANLRHPSLRAKKYDEAENIWQARVDGHYRLYFKIEGDVCQILDIMAHPK